MATRGEYEKRLTVILEHLGLDGIVRALAAILADLDERKADKPAKVEACERCGGPFVEVKNFDGETELHHNCNGPVWDAAKVKPPQPPAPPHPTEPVSDSQIDELRRNISTAQETVDRLREVRKIRPEQLTEPYSTTAPAAPQPAGDAGEVEAATKAFLHQLQHDQSSAGWLFQLEHLAHELTRVAAAARRADREEIAGLRAYLAAMTKLQDETMEQVRANAQAARNIDTLHFAAVNRKHATSGWCKCSFHEALADILHLNPEGTP